MWQTGTSENFPYVKTSDQNEGNYKCKNFLVNEHLGIETKTKTQLPVVQNSKTLSDNTNKQHPKVPQGKQPSSKALIGKLCNLYL